MHKNFGSSLCQSLSFFWMEIYAQSLAKMMFDKICFQLFFWKNMPSNGSRTSKINHSDLIAGVSGFTSIFVLANYCLMFFSHKGLA